MFYEIDFRCNDGEELQSKLNYLYGYVDDISTKILHRNRINLFYLLMERLVKHNTIDSFESALDIGCNAGVYSKIISDFGFTHVLGIDIVGDYIKKANDLFKSENARIIEFKILNAENINIGDKYNFILCTEVIEHTDNPTKLIENIKASLAPKGVAYITLPNRISFPYLGVFIYHKIRGQGIDQTLQQHLNYPFYRSMKLFRNGDLRIIETGGSNLIFDGLTLRFLYKTRLGLHLFPILNKLNFHISRIWPFKYLAQFFIIVVMKK